MQPDAEAMADLVVQTIKRALAPVQSRLADAESQLQTYAKRVADIEVKPALTETQILHFSTRLSTKAIEMAHRNATVLPEAVNG